MRAAPILLFSAAPGARLYQQRSACRSKGRRGAVAWHLSQQRVAAANGRTCIIGCCHGKTRWRITYLRFVAVRQATGAGDISLLGSGQRTAFARAVAAGRGKRGERGYINGRPRDRARLAADGDTRRSLNSMYGVWPRRLARQALLRIWWHVRRHAFIGMAKILHATCLRAFAAEGTWL